MDNINLQLGQIKQEIIDVTNFVEDYVSDYSILKILDKPIPKNTDKIKEVQAREELLDEYTKYIKYITSSKIIDMLTGHTSDTYSKSYLHKIKIIEKKLSDLYNVLKEYSKTLDLTGVKDIHKLGKVILSNISHIVEKYKHNPKVLEETKDCFLGNTELASIRTGEPLFILGLTFGLNPDSTFITIKDINAMFDAGVSLVLINNNISTSDTYTVYSLENLLSASFANFKKNNGITVAMVKEMDNVKLITKTESSSKSEIIVKQHTNKIGDTKIYESLDGQTYRLLKGGNINIIYGPKPRVFLYNKLTEQIMESNKKIWKVKEPVPTKMVFTELDPYKNKTEDEIMDMRTTGLNKNEELELLNLYDTVTIKKELFKMRKIAKPKIQLPVFSLRNLYT